MNGRRLIIQTAMILVGIVFLGKLFAIQVADSKYAYKAERISRRKVIEYPHRGLIFDRNNQLLVHNNPQYDLLVVPRNVRNLDTTRFCSLFEITREEFNKKMRSFRSYPYRPHTFLTKISHQRFAEIQDFLVDFEGFSVTARTVRAYPHPVMANAFGYISEISQEQLTADKASEKYYQQGDHLGQSGIERFYEEELRGKRGVSYKIKNAKEVVIGAYENGKYDTLAIPGQNLISTIDIDLQLYAEKLMAGKVGSVVAIEPSTGEILCMVSAPSYDPNLLTGKNYSDNFLEISNDTLKPFFNRPLMAMYPPGSMFKTIQALIAMQEGVLRPNEQIYCDGTLIGDHAPNGYYDVRKGIKLSSNNYFFKVFKRIIQQGEDPSPFIDSRSGLRKWKNYIDAFGLGRAPNIDLPSAKAGNIPGVADYDKIYGENRWKFSNIYSLSIGQGEVLVTPIQMANLGAILANRGHYYDPHIIKSIGESGEAKQAYLQKHEVGIDAVHFESVIDGMEEVVQAGSGLRAKVPNIAICGKTSTVENPHGYDHSGFMAFAPKDNPQIAIAVYVENAGWGGRAAASIAGLIIEKYINGEVSRKWIEDFAIKGEFIY
ncbi:MAG: penicillin-binding transpeptidase domain-containing protein [Bacteroidota bacterium]